MAIAVLAFTAWMPSVRAQPEWRTDLDAARAEALRLWRPLLVVLPAKPPATGDAPKRDDDAATWRDARLCAELARVVAVRAAVGDRGAREALLGSDGDAESAAAQQLVLWPDGRLASLSRGAADARTLATELSRARTLLDEGLAPRLAAQRRLLQSLGRKAARDRNAFHVVRTLLAHAKPDEFAMLLGSVADTDTAVLLLRDLAARHATTAPPLLAEAGELRSPRVQETAHRLAGELAAVAAARDAALAEAAAAGRYVQPIAARLPSLGDACDLAAMDFGDGVARSLAPGAITVLFFFLPNDQNLAADAERWNRFAAEVAPHGVRALALGATLDPTRDLQLVRDAGFTADAATYRYDERHALADVTMFPSFLIVDPDLRVVHRGHGRDQCEGLVRGMVLSGLYAN